MYFCEKNVFCKNRSGAKTGVQFRKLIPMRSMFLPLYQRSLLPHFGWPKKFNEFSFSVQTQTVVYRTVTNEK